jgi:hypothetical protein
VEVNRQTITSLTKNEDPLWQSARVHRKLKTIVPPEPTGEGLPPRPLLTEEDNVTITTVADTDDTSVHSASTSGTSVKLSQTGSTYRRAREEAEVLEKQKQTRYAYATFPSELSADLFGTPRPLPAAVQNRPRKMLRASASRVSASPAEPTKHIQRAHSQSVRCSSVSRGCHIYRLFHGVYRHGRKGLACIRK